MFEKYKQILSRSTCNLYVHCFLWTWMCLIASCQPNEPVEKKVNLSFYHWKTNWELTLFEEEYLQALDIGKIYLRFFDIDWNAATEEAIPLAILESNDSLKQNRSIVPTVFITNRTFLNLQASKIELLVDQTYQKIIQLVEKNGFNRISEIQIDCDWSGKTKANYFHFLNLLGKEIKKDHIHLSTTIRLHQIKYFKRTGVPPADKGVLMFYNMGTLNEWESENSILDLSIAKEYLTNFQQYPLKLDLALPLFSWTVLFRDQKMIKLINQLEIETLEDTTRFHEIKKNKYKVIKSTYLKGHYLYEGDLLRVESIESKQLEEAIQLLRPYFTNRDIDLIFYHLDIGILKNIPYESIELLKENLSQG